VLEAVFILLEFRSPSRRIFIGSHSLPPSLVRRIGPSPVRSVTPVRLVDRASQAGGYSSRTTNVPESLSDFSRPWNKNTLKTQPARKKDPTQSQAKQLQTDQELTRNKTTQKHTGPATHPSKIPLRAHTDHTGQEHRSDWCNLGSLG
jgi:hypothetical protein